MPHFRVDDALHAHPKAQRAGDEALGMWTRAGSFCMAYLTDGFVPEWWVKQQPKGLAKAKKLVAVGLWHEGAEHEGEKGYQFHEFTGPGRQDSKAEIEAEREKWRKKKADQRAMSPGDTNGDRTQVSPGDTNGDSPGESLRVTRDPTQPNPKENSGYVSSAPPETNARNGRSKTFTEMATGRPERHPEPPPADPTATAIVATEAAQLVAEVIPEDRYPADVCAQLRRHVGAMLAAPDPPERAVIAECLRLWDGRDGGPGLLPHLLADAAKALRPNRNSAHGNGRPPPSKRKVNAALDLANRFAQQPPDQPALEAR